MFRTIEGLSAQICLVRNRSFEKNGFESSLFSRQNKTIGKTCLLQKTVLCKIPLIHFLYKENIGFVTCLLHKTDLCTQHIHFVRVWHIALKQQIYCNRLVCARKTVSFMVQIKILRVFNHMIF